MSDNRAVDYRFSTGLKRAVYEVAPEVALFLYGSAARGTREPDSDYDVLVLSEHALSDEEEGAIRNAVYDFELENEIVVSLVFFARGEWDSPLMSATPFHANVTREGIQL
ncbi:MAG TPA: nucleotidyltransferase domain-containing protein [Candidatus Latescibacteria bacterium]|nr:nucleotidyltransferase domain-containing protein [Candidatus Latescibacterota bacterium]HPC45301.1 nucleotidyltransferase domain-containing protein [Candidatus Latescibacterota bacterium]HQE61345.1 nucleotidyltransferase domain-containing protein [Candidatus Latescibacterota bacterium]HRS95252.1 nucleotidyltransferase domain-containing protein [Candidatus Latescibacterota bacterium]HRU24494.1 nucleotidyltransferase domain-containing protein [Candidatus Latescibacterota bacterium]